jgi:hypothetical protein
MTTKGKKKEATMAPSETNLELKNTIRKRPKLINAANG